MTEIHRDEIAKLEALHEQHPDGRVFTHLAEAYRKAGELDRALETVELGLARHPEYASAHVVRGRILLDLGQAEGAASAFRDVLELDRHNLIALRALGDMARDGGRSAEALGYLRELQTIDPGDAQLAQEIERLEARAAEEAEATTAAAGMVEGAAGEAPGPGLGLVDAWGDEQATEVEGVPAAEPPPVEAAAPEPEPWPEAEAAEPSEAEPAIDASVEAAPEEHLIFGAEEWAVSEESLGAESLSLEERVESFEPTAPAEGGEHAIEDLDWAAGWWSSEREAGGEGEPAAVEEAPEPAEPAAEAAEDFHWKFPGWAGDEAESAVEVRTETMASLYAAQGLWHRAAEIYRQLLEERPGDAGLEARLREAESRLEEASAAGPAMPASEAAAFEETAAGGDQWLEGVESAWTGSQGAAGSATSPYDWPEESAEEAESGPTAGEYLRGLAAWQPSSEPAAPLDDSDEGEGALREWLAEDPVGPEGDGPEAPAGGAEPDAPAEGEDDEDVEMFRSWLQSLRK